MNTIHRAILAAAAVLLTAPLIHAQASIAEINKQLESYRSIPADQRPPIFIKLAADIRVLPAGPKKVQLADSLVNETTEGDNGSEALQAAADTLAKSLAESPVPAKKDQPPEPYTDLAKLVRFMHVDATLDDPLFVKAGQILAANDADAEKADFTLKDLDGKKVTLSQLRGKIVMVNFWATWCPPCRLEMPDLDLIYTHFQPQGLVVLAVTDESPFTAGSFIAKANYHLPVLLDSDRKVHKMFHITGIPTTFIFDREGKLIGETIDQTTQRQFLDILAKTDLHN
ncbi:MAG: TlpA disulfide reductase family protein [Terracidiphilus sp.]